MRISLQKFRNWYILSVVALLTLVADRVSKTVVADNMALYESWDLPVSFLRPLFYLTYTTNTGAAFGLFPDGGLFFVAVAFVVIAAIVFYYRHLPDGYPLVRVALGLQLGGALGNLTDRLRQGYVIDFINFNFWPLKDWPVFNVADSAIVVGVALLALVMLREDLFDQEEQASPSESNAAGEPDPSL